MNKGIFVLLLCGFFAVTAAESGNFAAGARWVSAVFSGKGKVSFRKDKDLYTQKHDCADGNTNWHTLDLNLAPGAYVFRVFVRTEGTGAGGAVLGVQLLGSKRLVSGKPVVTNGKWESAEVDFILTAKDPKIRLWLTQSKFTGRVQFRNPVIERQAKRSPYVILNKAFPEPGECRLDCEPGRVYRVSLKNLKSIPVTFLDQDRKQISGLRMIFTHHEPHLLRISAPSGAAHTLQEPGDCERRIYLERTLKPSDIYTELKSRGSADGLRGIVIFHILLGALSV